MIRWSCLFECMFSSVVLVLLFCFLTFGFTVLCDVLCFFKLKTAYEMRISDWSSDVCSSDLPVKSFWFPQRALRSAIVSFLTARPTSPMEEGRDEIGRASCRERVCQYV